MHETRHRRLRDALILGLATLILTTAAGCFGRFRAMNAVYDFNKQASDNAVVRSLVLFALVVIPVYEVAFLADWIVLNTLDFLNGPDKVAVRTLPDGTKVELAKAGGDAVRVRQIDAAGHERAFEIVRVGANAGYVRAADGRIVASVERLADGRLVEQAR
jgi:Domain of unknown function (DUF3332)